MIFTRRSFIVLSLSLCFFLISIVLTSFVDFASISSRSRSDNDDMSSTNHSLSLSLIILSILSDRIGVILKFKFFYNYSYNHVLDSLHFSFSKDFSSSNVVFRVIIFLSNKIFDVSINDLAFVDNNFKFLRFNFLRMIVYKTSFNQHLRHYWVIWYVWYMQPSYILLISEPMALQEVKSGISSVIPYTLISESYVYLVPGSV